MTLDTNLDIFGHVGYVFIAVGLLLLGREYKSGWLFRLVGELIWVLIGIEMHMSSIYIWSSIFMGLDILGYMRWRKNAHQDR